MSVESIIENPSKFSLNNLRKNIKWNNGKIDLNDLWTKLSNLLTFQPQPEGTNNAATIGHLYGTSYSS